MVTKNMEMDSYLIERETVFHKKRLVEGLFLNEEWCQVEYQWYAVYLGFVLRYILESFTSNYNSEHNTLLSEIQANNLKPNDLAKAFSYNIPTSLIQEQYKQQYFIMLVKSMVVENRFFELHQACIHTSGEIAEKQDWTYYWDFADFVDEYWEFSQNFKQFKPSFLATPLFKLIILGVTCLTVVLFIWVTPYIMELVNPIAHAVYSRDSGNFFSNTPAPWNKQSSSYEIDLLKIPENRQKEALSLSDEDFIKQIEKFSISGDVALEQSKFLRAEKRTRLLELSAILNTHDWQKLEYYEKEKQYEKSSSYSETYYSEQFFDNLTELGYHQPEQFSIFIQGWKQARQNDITPYLAEADFYLYQAFKRRGGAFAYKTSSDALNAFQEQLGKAYNALLGAEKIEGTPHHWYYYFLKPQVLLYYSKNKAKAVQVALAGVKRFPRKSRIIQALATPLAEKWYGYPSELNDLAQWYFKKQFNYFEFLGYTSFLTQICDVENMDIDRLRKKYTFNWYWIKQGILQELSTRKITMQMLNYYAFLAVVCNKPKVARYFFNKTNGHNWEYFASKESFNQWHQWAMNTP